MLNELHIENLAVIERADICFERGLNVLTGETGAGKSIVIDAIGAVLGDRVSRDLVRRGAERALVTASFDADGVESWLAENEIDADAELILQRRISADGKSSCRVCGIPVAAAQMKELASLLVDIHGQNDGRQLMDEKNHRGYLDRFGSYSDELSAFSEAYAAYRRIRTDLSALEKDQKDAALLCDSLNAQIEELERIELRSGEKAELSERRDLLRNAEKLTDALDAAYRALYGGEDNAVSLAQNAASFAQRAASYSEQLQPAVDAITGAVFSLSDAAEQLRDFRESLDFSEEEYDRLESRLAGISRLERKYGRDADELPAYLDACRARLDSIEYADERRAKLEKRLEEQIIVCRNAAAALSKRRHKAAEELQRRIVDELRELNMPSVRFSVEFEEIREEPGFCAEGAERLRFLMSANAGEQLGRISRIASGGELSRIMLAMKNVFGENDPVPTQIFDEIDTGVSGIAAQRVAEKLFTVSVGKQVLCVTHLPQIAAMADSHFRIEKSEHGGRTFTEVTRLDLEGRRQELARLHGGDHITLTTLASAGEQLEAAEDFKSLTFGKK